MQTRKPMKQGLDYIRAADWTPRLFTLKGAQQAMGRYAKRSPLARINGCHGTVVDCGEYFRGSIGADPR